MTDANTVIMQVNCNNDCNKVIKIFMISNQEVELFCPMLTLDVLQAEICTSFHGWDFSVVDRLIWQLTKINGYQLKNFAKSKSRQNLSVALPWGRP